MLSFKADKPIHDRILNINEAFFIPNLIKIQSNIHPELFKQLIFTCKNGKNAIRYAVEQSRWANVTALVKQYTPANRAEYDANGYFAALEMAIRGTDTQELTAALALLHAAKKKRLVIRLIQTPLST